MSHSSYTGADIGEYTRPGSNGSAIDKEGRLIVDQHGNRRVVRCEKQKIAVAQMVLHFLLMKNIFMSVTGIFVIFTIQKLYGHDDTKTRRSAKNKNIWFS